MVVEYIRFLLILEQSVSINISNLLSPFEIQHDMRYVYLGYHRIFRHGKEQCRGIVPCGGVFCVLIRTYAAEFSVL